MRVVKRMVGGEGQGRGGDNNIGYYQMLPSSLYTIIHTCNNEQEDVHLSTSYCITVPSLNMLPTLFPLEPDTNAWL